MAQTFTEIIENCKLTENMQIALACLINNQEPEKLEGDIDDEVQYFPYETSKAKENCPLNPKGLGGVFAGLGKRTEEIDEIVYIKSFFPKRKNAILIKDSINEEAREWAKKFFNKVEEVKVEEENQEEEEEENENLVSEINEDMNIINDPEDYIDELYK